MAKEQFGSHYIHLCRSGSVESLRSFIDEYWETSHILSDHEELLNWLYYDELREHYNFALARSASSDEIIGILGFIPTYIFDEYLLNESVTWLTIWQVRDDVDQSGFGLQLLNYVANYQSPSAVGAIGINYEVADIYRRLRYRIESLDQYYIINKNFDNFSLLDGFSGTYMSEEGVETNSQIEEMTGKFDRIENQFDLRKSDEDVPQLSTNYVKNRYITHPFFDYQIYAVVKNEEYAGMIVVRPVSQNGSKALRWVEFLGDPAALEGIGKEIQHTLQDQGAEYIDIYNYGVHDDLWSAAGMLRREPSSDIVVPNHYAPYEQRNIDITFAYKTPDKVEPTIYNGHADMDRPNSLDHHGV
jgi:hypothetical protein